MHDSLSDSDGCSEMAVSWQAGKLEDKDACRML
jgi:hypothetical protein